MFDRPHSKRDHVHREGSSVLQNGGNRLGLDLLWSKQGPIDREGCGVPQNGRNGPPTVETGVLFIGRGVAYRKTGLHGILFISTVDLLQPPRATVHPPSTSSSLHLRLFIHGLLFIQPPSDAPPSATVQLALSTGVLFNHPSTGYYSSSPPPAIVQPTLHGVLFIQPSSGSIDQGPVHPAATPRGPVHPNPHRELFIQTPPATLTVHPEAASIGFS